ncbi:hypothetical protein BJF88_00070 [Cellulosimicrobium sp. CUA-896]|nr:hypothetical protein BJF88_00070 [Cellulosimicrobium sp. CUA-896]
MVRAVSPNSDSTSSTGASERSAGAVVDVGSSVASPEPTTSGVAASADRFAAPDRARPVARPAVAFLVEPFFAGAFSAAGVPAPDSSASAAAADSGAGAVAADVVEVVSRVARRDRRAGRDGVSGVAVSSGAAPEAGAGASAPVPDPAAGAASAGTASAGTASAGAASACWGARRSVSRGDGRSCDRRWRPAAWRWCRRSCRRSCCRRCCRASRVVLLLARGPAPHRAAPRTVVSLGR